MQHCHQRPTDRAPAANWRNLNSVENRSHFPSPPAYNMNPERGQVKSYSALWYGIFISHPDENRWPSCRVQIIAWPGNLTWNSCTRRTKSDQLTKQQWMEKSWIRKLGCAAYAGLLSGIWNLPYQGSTINGAFISFAISNDTRTSFIPHIDVNESGMLLSHCWS